ncbi:glycosyltransferase family 2 protein [Heyndrickxia coagulans]|uniref:Glycosyltransferase family 2 protein n=1 Tax=Heyndrickxia coagulans TaxID=1398 RepID=A0AAW7CC30_HEYCO|nr:glycosyltransferase family 2 protein [Heyndrickxia coagulans]MDL5039749.1 glycosyltransferase family 2 protein [Heyndrickxia coagulans]
MYKPLVSVIVPVFNVEKYLHRCLTSIVNQTYRNIEILVVNDGSTDNSLNIIYQFKELDDRISVIEKEYCIGYF